MHMIELQIIDMLKNEERICGTVNRDGGYGVFNVNLISTLLL